MSASGRVPRHSCQIAAVVVATLYAVSFALPAVSGFGGPMMAKMPGWEAFAYGAFLFVGTAIEPASWTDGGAVVTAACWLANIWVLLGIVWLGLGRPREAGLRGTFGTCHAALGVWLWWGTLPESLGPGYYVWVSSAAVLAVAGWVLAGLRLRGPARGVPPDPAADIDPALRAALGLTPAAEPRSDDRGRTH